MEKGSDPFSATVKTPSPEKGSDPFSILFDLDGTLTGIAQALSALRFAGHDLYVATSKPRVHAERIVRHFALDVHFVAVHGCELDGTREDKRDLLAHLLRHHGLAPAATTMVGDRGVDMVAARHHGAHAIAALWGYGSRDELLEAGAQALVDAPAQVPAAMLSRTRRS